MKLLKQIIIAICLSCLLLLTSTPSNVLADDIFPTLSGAALQKNVADEYTPERIVDYNRGRDILYTIIDNKNGFVSGIYTGFSLEVDPNSNSPRQDAYQGGRGINAEHIYPRSKGAKGKAESDLHSLFPSRAAVNSARGNYPFAEINDSLTRKWFVDDKTLRTIPTEDIDDYSESINSLFEPRENKKGDVARAMFYFYTIYRFRADEEDPDFFPLQQETLCEWNAADPIDAQELERSHLVADVQGNENPFVIDPTLADRAYCN